LFERGYDLIAIHHGSPFEVFSLFLYALLAASKRGFKRFR
jgi:hypothetical protein